MKENNSRFETPKSKLVLGLVGSPRKLGNSEIIIKEISRCLPIEHKLSLIRLPSLNILPCNACYGCIMDKACPNQDDMAFLITQVVQADAIIVASPVYFLGAHSIFKRILDRAFLFYKVVKKTYGKPCILINVYGMQDRIGVSPHTLMTFAACLGLNIKASLNLRAALPGEIIMTEAGRRKAKELSAILFSGRSMGSESGCPFCGCEIVRIEVDKFICALCAGHFALDGEGKRVKIKEGGIFGTPENMLKHEKWLRGMKAKFLQKRNEIVKAIAGYKSIGEWINQ